MKKIALILLLPCLVVAGCNRKKLDQKIVVEILKKELGYPRLLDYDIYCSDPKHARKLLDAGLEKDGFVVIQEKQKLMDVGKPLIRFTEKAKPFLLPTSEKDKSVEIQKVKLADADVADIINIEESKDGKAAIVEFTTAYKNVSPFATLVNMNFKIPKKHVIHLSLHDNQWFIEKNADENFINKKH